MFSFFCCLTLETAFQMDIPYFHVKEELTLRFYVNGYSSNGAYVFIGLEASQGCKYFFLFALKCVERGFVHELMVMRNGFTFSFHNAVFLVQQCHFRR